MNSASVICPTRTIPALGQALAILPAVAQKERESDVLEAAKAASDSAEPFEKEGAMWIGELGFYFRNGRLSRVEPSWSPSLCNPGG